MINDDIIGDYARRWPHPKLTWEDVWISRAGNMRGVADNVGLSEFNLEIDVEEEVDE